MQSHSLRYKNGGKIQNTFTLNSTEPSGSSAVFWPLLAFESCGGLYAISHKYEFALALENREREKIVSI